MIRIIPVLIFFDICLQTQNEKQKQTYFIRMDAAFMRKKCFNNKNMKGKSI